MQTVGFIGLGISLLVMVWNVFGVLFSKGRRLRKLAYLALGFVSLICFALVAGTGLGWEAQDAGFLSYADMKQARDAGITDPTLWAAGRPERDRIAEQEKAAKQAQAAAEAEARRKADAELVRQKAEADKRAALEKQAACKKDLRCWAESVSVDAHVDCARAIQSLAKWDYQWTDGFGEPRFSKFQWRDQQKGIVTYMGNRLKLQNGFGAWKHMTYTCDYDPATKLVLNAEAF
ncbi:hypothetical protein SAMN05880590_102783 [Rhizobium sp. RU35A]|uniref:hypothetical protein n=1 Tax=Rhizobium sp. RU35A TaxID=1907414 RepID=UPI000954FD57|nr:hypothetical protein [Rhizobium sp. RU35A]SIQ24784.1 hypothetical protein SAMN05880590_102783 [Rhizobium sp. RU35A]